MVKIMVSPWTFTVGVEGLVLQHPTPPLHCTLSPVQAPEQ